MKKFSKVAIIIVISALLGWRVYQVVFLKNDNSNRDQRAATVAVVVTSVKQSAINDIGHFTGSLQSWSQFTVAPKIAGRLKQIFVNIGDEVSFNHLIATLDDDEYVQQVDRYKAELDVASATVEEAKSAFETTKRELDRGISLQERKLISEADLDATRAKYKAQEARYKVAVAQVA